MFTVCSNETKQGMSIRVFTSYRYINEFLSLKCAPDLLEGLKKSWNAKEISESISAKHAISRTLGIEAFGDDTILMLDVASGVKARTGALLACLSRWTVIAIDPLVKKTPKIRRLSYFAGKVEDFNIEYNHTVIVTAIHAHCKLDYIAKNVKTPNLVIIAIPCCMPLFVTDKQPIKEYKDQHIISPCRTVKIWKFRNQ